MSSGGYSGVTNGTAGAQGSLDQMNSELQASENEARIKTEALITELERAGVSFTKERIVFVTKDATGQIVWLEKGNFSAGLEHIETRHTGDFLSKHGVEKAKIPEHLKTIFQNGKVEYSRVTDRNGGYERLYCSHGQFYLLSGIGENGFIVSAYPIDETDAHRLIRRYKK